MPNLTLERQKGNYAESISASWLSRKCRVRPVATGTDIGIDLYCESVVGTSPFQHFWVQVKAITEKNLTQDGAYYDFRNDHLEYWSRKPVPVYAFLVPILTWPPQEPETIWGVKITDSIIRNGIPDQTTIRYATNEGFEAATIDEDVEKFDKTIVPFDTAAMFLPKGLVAPIVKLEESPLEKFPSDLAIKYLDQILRSIQYASELTLADLVQHEAVRSPQVEIRHKMHSITKVIEEDLTLLGLSSLANSAHLDGETREAIRLFERAREWVKSSKLSKGEKESRLEELDRILASLQF
jgi:hypothetical protein